jgi:hypothetical protein
MPTIVLVFVLHVAWDANHPHTAHTHGTHAAHTRRSAQITQAQVPTA